MDRLRTLGSGLVDRLSAGVAWMTREARLIVDAERFRAAGSWRERLVSVSWPRAGVVAGGLVVVALIAGLGGTEVTEPAIPGHQPPLPSDTEWRAAQAAERAMEADVSPALARASRSVTREDPS